jgi:hypothetical protein
MLGDEGHAMCGIDPTTAPKQLWYHMAFWGNVMQESGKRCACASSLLHDTLDIPRCHSDSPCIVDWDSATA